MIDRAGLQSVPPARRADMIYRAAQTEMSRRLWQAALGDAAPEPRQPSPLDARADDPFADLMNSLMRDQANRRPAIDAPRATEPAAAAPAPAASVPALAVRRQPAAVVAATGDSLVAGLGANARYATALAAAADRVGLPAPALAAIVDAEAGKASDGSWKIYSRNPRSSAAGLGQFLNRTWEGLAETRGTWLNGLAARQGWLGADGQVRAESRAALLATRYDPTASINGIADYARRNLDGLRRAGIPMDGEVGATARFAYLGHHLGLGDAVRFLRGNGLGEDRARILLNAQVGVASSARKIATVGDASVAHREWLIGYLDRNIRPDRFAKPAVAHA